MTCDTLLETLAVTCVVLLLSCGGDPNPGTTETGETETSGDGDGDPGDGDGEPGDGDGEPGDGDGEPGDGDGEPGDGDGEPGDGDGDPGECAAMDATTGPDPCVTPIGWAWDGSACVEILCSCEGTDCGGLFETEDACQVAYLECLQGAACSELGAQLCMAEESCAALTASPVSSSNGSSCLAEPEFVGCADNEGCDDALTWGCDPLDQPYLFPSSCMPDGFRPCAGPGDLPNCP